MARGGGGVSNSAARMVASSVGSSVMEDTDIALTQGAIDVNSYFTRLKILWDEHREFQHIPYCRCGAMRAWLELQQQEHVIQFLMGLNDSYAQTRAQILMLDPLPRISKVFALVVQEERQRSITHGLPSVPNSLTIGNSGPSATVDAIAGNSKPKRKRPICSHCGIQGHTIDKCYKLHGYPPGYHKFRNKGRETPQVNQAISTNPLASPGSSLSSLTASQCQQLIALLSSQLHSSSSTATFSVKYSW